MNNHNPGEDNTTTNVESRNVSIGKNIFMILLKLIGVLFLIGLLGFVILFMSCM